MEGWGDDRSGDFRRNLEWPTDLNNQGQVIGGSPTSEEYVMPSREKEADLGTLQCGRSCQRYSTTKGQIVGYSTDAKGDLHAFIWNKGKMTDLHPGVAVVMHSAINDSGKLYVIVQPHPERPTLSCGRRA
jgi:probable HAF family extracellular repeat protein